MGSINLHLKALNQQICHACGSYLSVGPVKVSSKGEIVCGRPNCYLFLKGEPVNSLYNIIATVCLFICTSHYSGCDKLLAFDKVKDHESRCSYAKLYECPFCYFQGNGCELVYHFGKTHPSYIPTEDLLCKILSYEGFENHVNAILKMNTIEIKEFIGHAPKIFFAICNVCNSKIMETEYIFFCTKYHIACKGCYQKKCSKCGSFRPWTNNSALHNIVIQCEWDGCSERKNIFEYLWHKQACDWRPCKCLCTNCKHTPLLSDLKEQWHLSPLLEYNSVRIVPDECVYWWPPLYQEVINVTFEVDRNGDGIIIMNNEENVLPVFFRVNIIDFFGMKCRFKWYLSDALQICDKIKYFKIEGFKKKCFSGVTLEAIRIHF